MCLLKHLQRDKSDSIITSAIWWTLILLQLESETQCFALLKLTSTKCEEPGYAVGQYPCMPAELEQVVRENVGEPEAEPVGKTQV